MGIRKIEDEIDFIEAMKKKRAEVKVKELKSKASIENFTKDRLRDLAKRHGVILALTPELRDEVKELQKAFNIPTSKIITEQIKETDVLKKFSKVDFKKLAMLAYQRILMEKEETGGIVPLSEVFEIVNTGVLKGNLDIKDVLKSMRYLEKEGVIDGVKLLESGSIMIHFFPVEYTSDQSKVIELAKEKSGGQGFLTIEDLCTTYDWSQERAFKVLKSLENTGLAKFRESILTGKQWFFPSL